MRLRSLSLMVLLFLVAVLIGCGNKPPAEPARSPERDGKNPSLLERLSSKPVTIPAGTLVAVRLGETLSTKASHKGETFSATVAQPVVVDNKVTVPNGAEATGTVLEAVPRGKFKGAFKLQIALNSINMNGRDYKIETAATRM
jgi:hypothetical protein